VLDLREVTAPYPGLRPFDSNESEIFFGREEHTDRLLAILQREHFLAVIGPSGSGKSSLVRAGLLPALAAGWLGTGSEWRIAVMRPGGSPIQRLARALMAQQALGHELIAPNLDGTTNDNDLALIAANLRRGPTSLLTVTNDALRNSASSSNSGPATQTNLLVLVDQFEELFTYAQTKQKLL
jgi:hypothetical protein